MRIILAASAFVLGLALSAICFRAHAAEPGAAGNIDATELATLRRAVEDGYAKLDHFTMTCFACAAETRGGKAASSIYFGNMDYGFDRKTKRLAIFKQGQPDVLVQDRHLFLHVCDDIATTPIYLEVVKERQINWNDVDEAERLVEQQCPLAAYERLDRCMVLPLLDGGIDWLFAGAVRVLKRADESDAADIFQLGHPQYKIWIGMPRPTAKLDPVLYPRCFRVENGPTKLSYAVDSSGIISAATGVAASEDLFGLPGNPVIILKKNCGFAGKGGQLSKEKELPLDLPRGAKCLGASGLRAAYLSTLKTEGVEVLQATLTQLEKDQQESTKQEDRLRAEIADARKTRKPASDIGRLQEELDYNRGCGKSSEYTIPRLRGLIAEVQKMGPSPKGSAAGR